MSFLNGVTAYDGIMAIVVLFVTIHGYWKGATLQIAPIMSLVLGYMIAMPMSVTTAHYFGDPPQNRLYALVTIYIGVSLVVYLMVRSFRAGIEKAKLSDFDKHIGALLGFLKGLLLTLSTTVILLIYSPPARDLILKSESSTIAAKIINAIYPILPQAMHQILSPYLHQLDGELPLDLRENNSERDLNSNILPDRSPSNGPMLSPTNSGARSSASRFNDDEPAPVLRRRTRQTVDGSLDEDDMAYPPARLPRRRTAQVNDRDPQPDRRYDSAARTNRRYPSDEDRDAEMQPLPNPPKRRALTPTPIEEDDPFHEGSPYRN